jgi:hypothetical protein
MDDHGGFKELQQGTGFRWRRGQIECMFVELFRGKGVRIDSRIISFGRELIDW